MTGKNGAPIPESESAVGIENQSKYPPVHQSPITGLLALIPITLGALFLLFCHPSVGQEPAGKLWPLAKLCLLFLTFMIMAVYELWGAKIYRKNFDFALDSSKTTQKKAFWQYLPGILLRQYALVIMLALVGLLFWAENFCFTGVIIFFWFVLPILLLLAPFYFYLVERYGKFQDDDELLLTGRLLSFFSGSDSQRLEATAAAKNLFRSTLIRGFFLPIMITSFVHWWKLIEENGLKLLAGDSAAFAVSVMGQPVESAQALSAAVGAAANSQAGIFALGTYFLFAMDTTVALIGYATSSRLLDTHMRSAEPNAWSWFVTLICYPPVSLVLEPLVWGSLVTSYPAGFFERAPVFSLVVSFFMLVFLAIYTYASLCFGLRFSNLSNRGIISSGPYALVRHPAYITKNLGFWLGAIPPVLAGHYYVLAGLLLLNFTYYLRAVTEEQHLLKDEVYRQYCAQVPFRFLPKIW
jgi:protein-S-isoprenylcysteine O-methyltransferase Ste14